MTCDVRINNLRLDGPVGEKCTYPNGPCLRAKIAQGTVVVGHDKTVTGDCAKEARAARLAAAIRVGPTDFQADQDARELIEDADIFGPKS